MRTPTRWTTGACILAASMAMSATATAAEGLYSAEDLMEADVYDNTGEEIGEVEDILLGDDMAVHSLVIETGAVLDMGGREVVAERGTFTVRMENEDQKWDDVEYEVHMEGSKADIKQFPEYDQDWWNNTKQSLAKAWENTKDISANAWESTKQATGSAWQNIRQGAEALGDKVEDATQ